MLMALDGGLTFELPGWILVLKQFIYLSLDD